jgi:peroxiredoxin
MKTRLSALLLVLSSACLLGFPRGRCEDALQRNVGAKVANFTLTDPRDGKAVSLADFADHKAVVVVFVGTECPLSNAYLPRLAELAAEYGGRGVQFLAVNANVQDTPRRMVEHARTHPLLLPLLKDEGNRLADRLEAHRMAEAFVLDAGGTIRYRGRIDDQYGIGYRRPRPTRRDLAEALDDVLAGRPVAHPITSAVGCRINRVMVAPPGGTVTFCKDVSRLLQQHCQECHRTGQIGPMPLLTYEDAKDWAETVREVVQDGRMPPWYADPRYGKFDNDRRLSRPERDLLLHWIDQGCPKGNDKDLPPPRDFVRGWTIHEPDLVLSMNEEYAVPAKAPRGGIPYKHFTIDPHFTEDRWVVQAEAQPGAPEVVHHVIVFILPPGRIFNPDNPNNAILCGAAPGDSATRLPPGTAKRIPAGSKLIFQLHYTPDGKPHTDRSRIGLVFAREEPRYEARTLPILNFLFRIPPGADNYPVESRRTFKQDVLLLGFMPHMHLRGKDFLYEAILPSGEKQTLLSVPHFDFNWQSAYRLTEPRPLPKDSTIHCVAHFDNSAGNPNNPDPTQGVTWGDQTWEEMMIGWVECGFERRPR